MDGVLVTCNFYVLFLIFGSYFGTHTLFVLSFGNFVYNRPSCNRKERRGKEANKIKRNQLRFIILTEQQHQILVATTFVQQ